MVEVQHTVHEGLNKHRSVTESCRQVPLLTSTQIDTRKTWSNGTSAIGKERATRGLVVQNSGYLLLDNSFVVVSKLFKQVVPIDAPMRPISVREGVTPGSNPYSWKGALLSQEVLIRLWARNKVCPSS